MVVSPGLWASASGAGVVESLSQEDTEDDAVARAVAPVAWSDEAVCTSPLAAFRTQRGASDVTFGFRETQVKATLGTIAHPLIIDHQYVCTIGYYRRALGSGGVWLWYADQEISVTADTTVEITDWFDVPNEEGFETIPLTCDVVDVTF